MSAALSISAFVVTPDFWQTSDANPALPGGRLVTASRFTEDWPHWEVYAAGEELVVRAAARSTSFWKTRATRARICRCAAATRC